MDLGVPELHLCGALKNSQPALQAQVPKKNAIQRQQLLSKPRSRVHCHGDGRCLVNWMT